jgi:hypothetical protein
MAAVVIICVLFHSLQRTNYAHENIRHRLDQTLRLLHAGEDFVPRTENAVEVFRLAVDKADRGELTPILSQVASEFLAQRAVQRPQ